MVSETVRMRTSLLVIAVLCFCLVGCNKSVEEIVAKDGPPVMAMIKRVKALEPRVKATPRYGAAAVSPVKDLMVMRSMGGNALVIHERDLSNPEGFVYAPERPDFPDEAFSCIGDAQRKGTHDSGVAPWTIEKNLQTCAAIKYVLVMRTHQRRMAKMIAGESFMGGRVDGDVVAFTPAGHSLGGFAWHAESSDMIPVKMGATKDDMQYALDHHMREKVEDAIRKEITRNFGDKAAW